jgi:hypothetical protein
MYMPHASATLPEMAERKGKPRIIVELVTPEEELFGRQVRAAAALQGVSVRDYVLAALRERVNREQQRS